MTSSAQSLRFCFQGVGLKLYSELAHHSVLLVRARIFSKCWQCSRELQVKGIFVVLLCAGARTAEKASSASARQRSGTSFV